MKIGPHSLEQNGDLFVFTMNNGQNTFDNDSLAHYNEMLDIVERHTAPCTSLVVTGTDKHWCTGLDLPVISSLSESAFIDVVQKLQLFLARFITFPCVTVAAINGHCFGGGALWSLCFDYKMMRDDRGFWCIPAIDFPTYWSKTYQGNDFRTFQTTLDQVLTGKRFVATEAALYKIIDGVKVQDQVLPHAQLKAQGLCKGDKDNKSIGMLKQELHCKTVGLLQEQIVGGKSAILFNAS